nr:MAG TPA_asm: hypothetical protein [Caudoviricetes sp.]
MLWFSKLVCYCSHNFFPFNLQYFAAILRKMRQFCGNFTLYL